MAADLPGGLNHDDPVERPELIYPALLSQKVTSYLLGVPDRIALPVLAVCGQSSFASCLSLLPTVVRPCSVSVAMGSLCMSNWGAGEIAGLLTRSSGAAVLRDTASLRLADEYEDQENG